MKRTRIVGVKKKLRGGAISTNLHDSALSAKVSIRRWLVDQLGGRPRILDCFCAAGMLWQRAYDKTPNYLGLDLKQFNDERRTIVCDSRRFLRHADVKIEGFNLFDLDAFGTPLEHLAIICHRLRLPAGQRVGFLMTDGTGFNANMNGTSRGLLRYVGVSAHKQSMVQGDYRDDIIAMATGKAMETAKLKVISAKKAEQTGARGGSQTDMRYSAILAESVGELGSTSK